MKNRKIAFGCALAVIVAILLFFVFYSGQRGEGTYAAKNYAGLYDKPSRTGAGLVVTAQPGEQLQVTHVSKKGWATVEYPGHGVVYTNFFSLVPQDVSYPIKAGNFYDGNPALLFWFQMLLWLIFLIAIGLFICLRAENEKAVFVAAALLVAAQIAYTIIYFAYIYPADVIIGTAFDSAPGVVFGFLVNMLGLAVLGLAHTKLVRLTWDEVHAPGRSTLAKALGWALMVFIVLFSLYIVIQLIVMAFVVLAVLAGLALMFAIVSFISDYERSHVTLVKDPYTGKWMDGHNEYEVDELRDTARKKKFFEL